MQHQIFDDRSLVLVAGAGRSGTSTMAGILHYLGFHVPRPVLKPNKSNPRGFFESTWPLWFHRRLMSRAVMEQTDGRPEAVDLIRAQVDDDVRDELATWLRGALAKADRVVVKDPRAAWVPQLWQETTTALGGRMGTVTMLRHPAEVVGSRSTYYSANRPAMDPWEFAVMNLCGWVNGNLVVERQTRDIQRAFVRYDELMQDWRAAMRGVRDGLELEFDHDLGPAHHQIDDFVDPQLNRHRIGWADLDMPRDLEEIAEGVWNAMATLAHTEGRDTRAEAALDELTERYASLYRTAAAISHDKTTARVREGRAEAERSARAEIQRLQRAKQQAGRSTPFWARQWYDKVRGQARRPDGRSPGGS